MNLSGQKWWYYLLLLSKLYAGKWKSLIERVKAVLTSWCSQQKRHDHEVSDSGFWVRVLDDDLDSTKRFYLTKLSSKNPISTTNIHKLPSWQIFAVTHSLQAAVKIARVTKLMKPFLHPPPPLFWQASLRRRRQPVWYHTITSFPSQSIS